MNIFLKIFFYNFFFYINIFSLEFHKENLLNAKYIICIDGGGSKTSMTIINNKGQSVALYKNNKKNNTIVSGCSNINFVGIENFSKVLDDLFDDLYVDEFQIPFNKIQQSCLVVAGFSGGSISNLKKAQEKFKLKGFEINQLFLTSDAELALELIRPKGMILIAGTGSIAFGIENNNKFRAGGFGKYLNDGGNGYAMGISAIRAALEDEAGYGVKTVLTQRIKEMYNVKKVSDLVSPIHSGEILQDKIALLSNEIFKNYNNDQICKCIFQDSVNHLINLIINVLKRMETKEIDIILIGGLFNHTFFVDQIKINEKLKNFINENKKTIAFRDKSKDNIAIEVAKQIINKN